MEFVTLDISSAYVRAFCCLFINSDSAGCPLKNLQIMIDMLKFEENIYSGDKHVW